MGHCLSALLCLIAGLFLLLLVRFQWIWFLWPLAILALFVLGFGVLLARSAMVAVNASLPVTNQDQRPHEDSGSCFLDGDCQRWLWALCFDDYLRTR